MHHTQYYKNVVYFSCVLKLKRLFEMKVIERDRESENNIKSQEVVIGKFANVE